MLRGHHRVVVTGIGPIAPNGIGIEAFWSTLLKGQSGIGFVTQFDTTDFPMRIVGEIKGFDLSDHVNGNVKAKRMARHTQLALAATQMALSHSGLTDPALKRYEPIPLIMGVSSSAFDIIEQGKERLMQGGPKRVSSYLVTASQPHAIANALFDIIGVRVQSSTICSACPAGIEAIATAAALIRRGKADVAIAGGSDAPITPLALAAFAAAGLVPEGDIDPATASRPFDRDRSGGILSEGSAMLVLEDLEHALARGAKPLLEITGYANIVDSPGSRPASGLGESMVMALANAYRHPDDVQYICAHGPSDPVLDLVETETIKALLGRRAYRVPISSIKGVTGNPLAAAGPLQVCACALACLHGTLPPTANYRHPDPLCDLDYVVEGSRAHDFSSALVNVHGLGGGNGTLFVERVKMK